MELTKAQVKELLLEEGFAATPKIWKKPGDSIGATGTFKHKGKGGTARVMWGLCPGSDMPLVYNTDKVTWVRSTDITLTDDADWKTYSFSLSGTMPSIAAGTGTLEGNFFDCVIGIQMPVGTWAHGWTKGKDWEAFDDIYGRSDLLPAEFKDITGTFS